MCVLVYVQICKHAEKLWVSLRVWTCVPYQDPYAPMHQLCPHMPKHPQREHKQYEGISVLNQNRVISSFNCTAQWSSAMGELCKYSMLSGSFSEEEKDSSRDLFGLFFLCGKNYFGSTNIPFCKLNGLIFILHKDCTAVPRWFFIKLCIFLFLGYAILCRIFNKFWKLFYWGVILTPAKKNYF